jgi:hypothetical protein
MALGEKTNKQGGKMKIMFKTKNVYGKELIYVVGPVREAISTLTGKQTVDFHDLKALVDLGHELVDLDRLVNVLSN